MSSSSTGRPALSPVSLRPPAIRVAPPPRPLTSFVGREREIAELCSLLRREEVRLVNLTGPGGVGKTRLAIRVAGELVSDFAETWYVGLDAIRDPALVGPVIAHALGLREQDERTSWQRIAELCVRASALLVLDNLEQVVASASHVVELLMSCPELTVLATSRIVLRASGEFDYPVLPLALPPSRPDLSIAQMTESPAVALFLQRAQAANPALRSSRRLSTT